MEGRVGRAGTHSVRPVLSRELSSRRQRSTRKVPEPLRRAVAACCAVGPTQPLAQLPRDSLPCHPVRTLEDYLGDAATVDIAYEALLEHATVEKGRSPHVTMKVVSLLKKYLFRYGPAISTLEHIDGFCADLIAEQREAVSAMVLGRARAGTPELAHQEASAGMLKSLQYVRAVVARNLPPHLIRSSARQGDPAASLTRAATASPHAGALPPTPGPASSGTRAPGRLAALQVDVGSAGGAAAALKRASAADREVALATSMAMARLIPGQTGPAGAYAPLDMLSTRWSGRGSRAWAPSPVMTVNGELSRPSVEPLHGAADVSAASLLLGSQLGPLDALREGPGGAALLHSDSVTGAVDPAVVRSHIRHITTTKRAKADPTSGLVDHSSMKRRRPLFQYRYYSEQQALRLSDMELEEVMAAVCSGGGASGALGGAGPGGAPGIPGAVGPTPAGGAVGRLSSPATRMGPSDAADVAASVLIKLLIDMYLVDPQSATPLTVSLMLGLLGVNKVSVRVRAFDLVMNLGVHAHLLHPLPVEDETSGEPYHVSEADAAEAARGAARRAQAVAHFEEWLLGVLCEMLLFLLQVEEAEEAVWAASLSCLLYLTSDRGRLLLAKLRLLDIRAVGKLLEVCVLHGWAEAVHTHLIQMALCQLYYCTPGGRCALAAAQGLSVATQEAHETSPLLSPVEGATQRSAPGEDGPGAPTEPPPLANGGHTATRQKSLQSRQAGAGEPRAKAEGKDGRERKKKGREQAGQGEVAKKAREGAGEGAKPRAEGRGMLDLEQLQQLGGIHFICDHYALCVAAEESRRSLFAVVADWIFLTLQAEAEAEHPGMPAPEEEEMAIVVGALVLAGAPEALAVALKIPAPGCPAPDGPPRPAAADAAWGDSASGNTGRGYPWGASSLGSALVEAVGRGLARDVTSGRLQPELLERFAAALDSLVQRHQGIPQEFLPMVRCTLSSSAVGGAEQEEEEEAAWRTLHLLLHSPRHTDRRHGQVWLLLLLKQELETGPGLQSQAASSQAGSQPAALREGLASGANLQRQLANSEHAEVELEGWGPGSWRGPRGVQGPAPRGPRLSGAVVVLLRLLRSESPLVRRGFTATLESLLLLYAELEAQGSGQEGAHGAGDGWPAHSAPSAPAPPLLAQNLLAVMSSALWQFIASNESDRVNILQMCSMMLWQLCVPQFVPTAPVVELGAPLDTAVPLLGGAPAAFPRAPSFGNGASRAGLVQPVGRAGTPGDASPGRPAEEGQGLAITGLFLQRRAAAARQLLQVLPTALLYWPLMQLAPSASDPIALATAVGSHGIAGGGGAIDTRAALLLLLMGKCSDSREALEEVGGDAFFRSLLDDPDARMAYWSSAFLVKRMMVEQPEMYRQALHRLIFTAQQTNNEKLLENPYLQTRGILQQQQHLPDLHVQ